MNDFNFYVIAVLIGVILALASIYYTFHKDRTRSKKKKMNASKLMLERWKKQLKAYLDLVPQAKETVVVDQDGNVLLKVTKNE